MKKHILLAITAAIITTGCTTPDIFNENGSRGGYSSSYKETKDADLISASHKAGENLMSQASYLQDDHKAILITSMADITDIDSSSALGLIISEQIGNRFAQYGFPVVDLRTRKDIRVRENNGEFIISRDIKKISKSHTAGAALLGTYAVGKNHIYVSTRLVRPEDNRILASYDFDIPMGPDAKALVRSKTK